MQLSEFQSFVRDNATWFRGVRPESTESLARAESQLGCALPTSLKWLLVEWGYTGPCGVGSLEDAVATTLRCRTAIPLPPPFVILNEWGDVGVVCLNSTNGSVIWTHAHELPQIVAGHSLHDADVFEDFPAWVVSRLEVERSAA
jgi:hypothetical protein